jgi:hypothetical protein
MSNTPKNISIETMITTLGKQAKAAAKVLVQRLNKKTKH